MKIAVIGAGYVGLVSGACFAEFGFNVTNVDLDEKKIAGLKLGQIPIYEPGLDSMVKQGLEKGLLEFTTDLHTAVSNAEVIMIAVGTPTRESDGYADLTYVFKAAEEIARSISRYTVVVTKSTVPMGTCRKIAEIIEKTRPDLKCGKDFDVASNPEFLREGSAINDFLRPDRIVVGTNSDRAKALMSRLYRPLYLIETPIVFTDIETSEMIKYGANSFLAMKIAFVNQMSDLCEKMGADVQDFARGIGLDRRIGRLFLNVGPGYGGSCFPKDTLALSMIARDNEAPLSLIEKVVESNDNRKYNMAGKIIQSLGERKDVKGSKVAVLGITFKPNTDDLRDAASLVIVQELLKAGIEVTVYDPLYHAGSSRVQHLDGVWEKVNWSRGAYQAMQGADAAVILTEWNEFRALDVEKIIENLISPDGYLPLLIDLRNIYKLHEMNGLEYISLGRKAVGKTKPSDFSGAAEAGSKAGTVEDVAAQEDAAVVGEAEDQKVA